MRKRHLLSPQDQVFKTLRYIDGIRKCADFIAEATRSKAAAEARVNLARIVCARQRGPNVHVINTPKRLDRSVKLRISDLEAVIKLQKDHAVHSNKEPAHRWIKRVNCTYESVNQSSCYADGHNMLEVVEYRKKYVQDMRDISRLRLPLWVLICRRPGYGCSRIREAAEGQEAGGL